MHMLQRRQVRGDGLPTHNHRQQPLSEAGGSPNLGVLTVRHKGCRRTHSLGNPSDIYGIRLSDNSRRMPYCERQGEDRQSWGLSVPILPGIWGH